MQSDCPVCLSYKDDGLPGANFPEGWKEMPSSGAVYASWVPVLHGKSHLRACQACGTVWNIGWNPRDSVYEGCSKIPKGAQAILQAGTSAAQVLRDGLANDVVRSLVSTWFENSAARRAEMIDAIERAIGGHHGALDGRSLQQCLVWLDNIAGRDLNAAKTLGENRVLLELLAALPDRPRPVADRLAVRTSVLTAAVERIGKRLQQAAPEWAARLCGLHSLGARRERALAILRQRLEDDAFPHELVLQAITELASREAGTEPLEGGQVDLMIEVLERARAPGPGRSSAIACNLLIGLNAKLRAGLVPGRRFQVTQALATDEEGKPMPSIRDAYGHAPASLRLLQTWTVDEIEHAAFHDADNGTIVEVHDPSCGLTSFMSMVVKYHAIADLGAPGVRAATRLPVEVFAMLESDPARPRAQITGTAAPIAGAFVQGSAREEFLASWRVSEEFEFEMEYRAFYDVLTDTVVVYSRRAGVTEPGAQRPRAQPATLRRAFVGGQRRRPRHENQDAQVQRQDDRRGRQARRPAVASGPGPRTHPDPAAEVAAHWKDTAGLREAAASGRIPAVNFGR